MSHKTNKAIAIVMLILVAILFGECARFVAGVDYVDAAAAPSPTRKPIKTPTSAPTEPPKPTDAPEEWENPVFLPIIVNGQAPGHDYPEIENCRIVASPMEDLVDMCCGLYGMLCEYAPAEDKPTSAPTEYRPTSAPTEYRPTSAPTETPVWEAGPTGWVRPAVTPTGE